MYGRDFQWNYALTRYIPAYIGDARSERFNGHSFFTSIAAVLIIPSPGTSVCDKSTCRLNTGSTIVFHRTRDIYYATPTQYVNYFSSTRSPRCKGDVAYRTILRRLTRIHSCLGVRLVPQLNIYFASVRIYVEVYTVPYCYEIIRGKIYHRAKRYFRTRFNRVKLFGRLFIFALNDVWFFITVN